MPASSRVACAVAILDRPEGRPLPRRLGISLAAYVVAILGRPEGRPLLAYLLVKSMPSSLRSSAGPKAGRCGITADLPGPVSWLRSSAGPKAGRCPGERVP